MYNKIYSIHLFGFDLEIELKTTIDDTFYSLYNEHLQEKVLANEVVEEFDFSFDNRYIASARNSQAASHPCENNQMIENAPDDSIDD